MMGRVDLAGKLDDARARVEAETPVEDRGLAKFARLTRKDARVRSDQDAALTALAKTLMRRRLAKAERITENTLIRVGIDLLLAHADELRGSTEDELRDSVTSELRHFGTSALRNSGTPEVTVNGSLGLPHSDGPELPHSRNTGIPGSGSPVAAHSGDGSVPEPGRSASAVLGAVPRSDR
ncbi:hypothetical protein MRBLMI12_001754 [Microbacterium sp. LMI12-1-1.1]|uniref:hypothetical protein n=1 Tax=Microbacterium sp. LMI12-1-1.1 TaxID=3135225 RepID=UPI00342390C9